VRLIRRAFSEGAKQGRTLHVDPYFESLAGYPPFDAMLRLGD
jgi:hypothetical protein